MEEFIFSKNAAIVSDGDTKHIRYHTKCEFCKNVDKNITYGCNPTVAIPYENTVVCSKCNQSFKVKIGRFAHKNNI